MKYLFFIYAILYGAFVCAEPLAPFPIFLKSGFSSVIEFNEAPSQVVLGDAQSFQIEKLNKSLAIRSNNPNTQSNLFVYFNGKEPYIFILTSSDDAEPTFYKKFDFPAKKIKNQRSFVKSFKRKRSISIVSSVFDSKKDTLIIEVLFSADSTSKISPIWENARIRYKTKEIKPKELWSERQVVQKDSAVKARFVFVRPDIPRNLKDVLFAIPTKESKTLVQIKFPTRSK